jgi:hypothetical protein
VGQITPNIGIYVPTAGEKNYDQSFLAGMINIDQHDHSGGPNKGVPIPAGGIADGSITYLKLASNVVDTSTGLAVSGTLPNQIQTVGVLKNLYTQSLVPSVGYVAINGATVNVLSLVAGSGLTITNPTGASGNSVISQTETAVHNITGTTNQTAVTFTGSTANVALAPTVINSTQPCFQAKYGSPVGPVTGSGTVYTMVFNTVTFDQNSNYNSSTGQFTAPITGNYLFNISMDLIAIALASTSLELDIYVNGTINTTLSYINPSANYVMTSSLLGSMSLCGTQILRLSMSSTVTIVLTVSGAGVNSVIVNNAKFSGVLLN